MTSKEQLDVNNRRQALQSDIDRGKTLLKDIKGMIDKAGIARKDSTLLELLADLEHQQWVHWTKYMLETLGFHSNNQRYNVRRWFKQIETPYSDLSEKEKESDRTWARKVIDLIEAFNK